MPHFMLRELLQQEPTEVGDPVSILHFNLVPGGICRDLKLRTSTLNRRFSETILESVKLLLAAPLNEPEATRSLNKDQEEKIRRLMDAVATIIKSDEIIAGGIFPHLIAQKAS